MDNKYTGEHWNNCNNEEDFVQDCVECAWRTTSTNPLTVYISNLDGDNVFASGVFKYTNGFDNSFVTVTFLHNGTAIGNPIEVCLDSCITFTISKFNEIRVIPSAASVDLPAEGEIHLTIRYTFRLTK